MRGDLPVGTVTFLFTDVEGSTRLLHEVGAERYAELLAEHRRVLRGAFVAHGGVEVDTQGDALFVAFPTAPGALAAAVDATRGLEAGPVRVRIGLHTGAPLVTEEGYVGVDVHRAARIAACGHGGQVLVSEATAGLVDGTALHDLGAHRLKDLSAAERIYQVGDAEFPALKTLYRTNLPVPATPFVGRLRELAALHALVEGGAQLVTLTGPGGTGKTRLVLQAAGAAADGFPAGVWWVPLAALRDPALVLPAVAEVVGAPDDLASHVGDRRMLVVLDNMEHVIAAADDLAVLLGRCPGLVVLVTSREVLRIPGEQAFPVAPLDEAEGVELFISRARATNPSFAPDPGVPELCARLEHLPLALELAAARTRVLAPAQLLTRLAGRLDLLRAGRGVDVRQQTLRATIEWSHDLLDDDERRLFARLAVFVRGCAVEVAEEVCEAGLDVLESLVDKSLLRAREGGRLWMLETIREFADERLAASGEETEMRRRHALYFVALLESADPHLVAQSREWLDRVAEDHDNVRTAFDWLSSEGETQLALRLAGSMWGFWEWRGHIDEGLARLESALAADLTPTPARAKALDGASNLASDAGHYERAMLLGQEALALYRGFGDRAGEASVLLSLGITTLALRRPADALPLLEAAAALFASVGDTHSQLDTIRRVAWAHDQLGELERARAIHEDNLVRSRHAGNRVVEARIASTLAGYALNDGRLDDAVTLARRFVALDLEVCDPYGDLLDVQRLSSLSTALGDAAWGMELLATADLAYEETSWRREEWLEEITAATRLELVGRLTPEEYQAAVTLGRTSTPAEQLERALDRL